MEAPDGSLWAATGDGAVLHGTDRRGAGSTSAGRTRTPPLAQSPGTRPGGRGSAGTRRRLPAAAGCRWTRAGSRASTGPPGRPSTRQTRRRSGAVFLDHAACRRGGLGGRRGRGAPVGGTSPHPALLEGSPGSTAPRGPTPTAELSGTRNTTSAAAGPDGTIWAAADPGAGAVTDRRFDGRSWVSYGYSDGLSGADESCFVIAWALPTRGGVFVGTGAGIYRVEWRSLGAGVADPVRADGSSQ